MKFLSVLFAMFFVSQSLVAETTRHALFNGSTFPISRAVEVTPDTTMIFHSGLVPKPQNPDLERSNPDFFGDTETQTLSVFSRFEESLSDLGVGFSDVVKMTVFLVGDSEQGGEMDFRGFMRAYTKYFGTAEQPNKPARSVVQVAGLAGGPTMLVEIEMVIAKPNE